MEREKVSSPICCFALQMTTVARAGIPSRPSMWMLGPYFHISRELHQKKAAEMQTSNHTGC